MPPTRCFFGAESEGEFSAFARAGLERLFDRRRTKAARAAEDAAAGQQIVLMDEACLDSADTHDLAEFAGWLAWLRVALVIVRQPSPSGAPAGQAAPADPERALDRKQQGSAKAAENRSIVGLYAPAGDGQCDRHRVQFVWANLSLGGADGSSPPADAKQKGSTFSDTGFAASLLANTSAMTKWDNLFPRACEPPLTPPGELGRPT